MRKVLGSWKSAILNSRGTRDFNTRLGVATVADGALFELPTSGGADGNGDFPFYGGFNGAFAGRVELALEDSGYTLRVTQDGTFFYEAEEIAYNGTPLDLASIEFIVQGGGLILPTAEAFGLTTLVLQELL